MDIIFDLRDLNGAIDYFSSRVAYTCAPADANAAYESGEPVALIDVRARADFEKGHARGAIHLPVDAWESCSGLAKSKPNIVYGYSSHCRLARRAALVFARAGFPVKEMLGGMVAWREARLPVAGGSSEDDELLQAFP